MEHDQESVGSEPDVIVIGAGAAGLMAAVRAARLGARVVVLEKNRKPGAKILASGGTRCNLTTSRDGLLLERSFIPQQAAFLRPSFRALSPARLLSFFEELGVTLHLEALEKYFPDSGRASTVLEALLRASADAGVEIRCSAPVLSLKRLGDGRFEVGVAGGCLTARRVILASGGRSYPKIGTTGDGYTLAARCGHSVSPQHPALCAIQSDDPLITGLAGLSVPEALVAPEGSPEPSDLGGARPLLFTHRGISGPAAMNSSGALAAFGANHVVVDLAPSVTAAALDAQMGQRARENPKRALSGVLPPEIPDRLRRQIVDAAGLEVTFPSSELRREWRARLVAGVKSMKLRVLGVSGFDHAEVTRGGVLLSEVSSKTMESLICPGLHFAGEILDLDGPIGGFNFQAAFSTGYVAGDACGKARGGQCPS